MPENIERNPLPLVNGTLCYNITKKCEVYMESKENYQKYINERNKFDPSYPSPNDIRFQTTPSTYTIENDSLYRDGNLLGKIYNNKTGNLVEVTGTTDSTITVKDIEEQSNGGDIPLVVVQKLTGKKVIVTPPNAHEYVEIGGLKWATMNVGAESVTDTGLYFAWGDTQGYTASQVGSGEGQKYFGWADYKYGNGTSSPGTADMTKYNSTDGKTVLDASDDAAQANWGGNWRMPTKEEFQILKNAVNTTRTTDYQNSGVSGLICTDKQDNSKVLFFPDSGYYQNGTVYNGGYYLTSSLDNNIKSFIGLSISYGIDFWTYNDFRCCGQPVRGVLG